MANAIPVRDGNGKVWMIDPSLLKDPNEPTNENVIGLTTDNQLYQRVGGRWFRLLRCDEVAFATVIAPVGKGAFQLDFSLGREIHYTD
jgi:hypothetical protein